MKKYLSKVASVAASLSLVVSALPVNAATTAYDYVDVSATVTQSLAFTIVSATDATTTVDTCPLGTLSISAVNTCKYALRIATNASAGFVAGYRGATELVNASAQSIAHVTDNEVTTSTEEYGLRISPSTNGGLSAPNTYNNPSVVAAGWDGTDEEINTTATSTPVLSYGAPFDAHRGGAFWQNSTLTVVTHKASISVGTPEGVYSQRVWWEVTTSP